MYTWPFCCVLSLLSAAPQAPLKPISIINAILHQMEDGPAIYADQKFIAGETIFFSFQVKGYQVSNKKRVRLSYQIEALDSHGVRLVKPESGKIDTELAPQDKDWLPKVRHSFVIPPHALPGKYKVVAAVKDELNLQEAKVEVSVEVQGRYVEPSETLAVRNLRFLRREDDTEPLAVAAYRPGDRLWARFDITGYEIAEENRIHVAYGISILNAEGKVLFSQPQAAVEQDRTFYPKRHTPGIVSLNIQPGTARAEYTILVSVRDEIGNQTGETRGVFRVE
jgi:hypothetical protein